MNASIKEIIEFEKDSGTVDALEDKDFFYPLEKKPIMLENLRSIFYKLNLSEKETRILSSVFAGLTKKRVIDKVIVKFINRQIKWQKD